MAFASVYPHYITKAEKKGRTKEEVYAVGTWPAANGIAAQDTRTLTQCRYDT